ncbi:MFS transporter [Candidatus Parcubacteria bacterium]|nr:MFS transporter [Patescibacteria group bacterium]MCG2694433.1 MFS transporter [Candidatus Parcubacteria bacterium]
MSLTHFHYLNHHLSRQLNELYVSTVIFAFGQSMILLFIPIYLFQLGYSVQKILLFFTVHYFAYALILPFFGKIISRLGYEASIGWSMPLYAIFLLSLFGISQYPALFYISAIAWATYKSLYWPAFHADFTNNSDSNAMGEEISSLKVIAGVVSILGPTIGGFILMKAGFNTMFIIVVVLSFVSLIPLLKSKEKYEQEPYSIKRVLRKFIMPTYRKDLIANIGTGEDVIAQSVWPIFLLTVLSNYEDVGILTTVTLFIAFIMILVMGKLANKPARTRLIKTTTIILSLAWFARIFSFNWLSIFASDSLYKSSKRTLDVPIQALVYSRSNKKRLLHYLVFREMALSFGKALTAFLGFIVIFLTGNLLYTFAMAGILALFYFYWTDKILDK